MLRYRAVPIRSLDAGLAAAWTAIAQGDPLLASPFFRPEYAQAVGEVRPGGEVCVVSDGETPVGFHSYERHPGDVGQPVGGSMSNFQGMVARPGTAWTAMELMQGARLATLKFHHLVEGQSPLASFITRRAESPIVDLAAGWDAYLASLKAAHASSLSALQRKMRKLEREVGPLRFEAHTTAPAARARLIEWKRGQYARTASKGSLMHEWGVAVLDRLFAEQRPEFAGTLSTLHAGDRLVAVHAGIRTATTWHYWFPTYDPEAGAYSPGLALMHEMCRWACDHGLARIDLGPGEGAHKDLFANAGTQIGVGQVDGPPVSAPPSSTKPAGLLSRLLGRVTRPGSGG